MIPSIPKLTVISAALISLGLGVAPILTDIAYAHVTEVASNVRAEPTVYSNRITALPTGTNVLVEGSTLDETWGPIREPVDGYVASRCLGDC